MSKLLITGVPKGRPLAKDPGARLEIATFVKDHRQFSLYVQALDKMMYGVKHTDVDSYFSLAGVHGWPLDDWNDTRSNRTWFCVHRTIHFPTWHRPYVAVFEQVIQEHAVKIAATYTTTDKHEWELAAANIRQPYWGWDDRSTFVPPPEVISMEEVLITYPDGRQGNFKNPLFSYTLPDGYPEAFKKDWESMKDVSKPALKPFLTLKSTVRHSKAPGTKSQPDKLIAHLTAQLHDTVNYVQAWFGLKTWQSMSDGVPGVNGLEGIHGMIHNMTGGFATTFGHMQEVMVAAFDPIFWLHHAQVDRLTDLWYTKHQLWITEEMKGDLYPFWKQPTGYWKSTETADSSTNFNYVIGTPKPNLSIIASVNKRGKRVPAKFLPLDADASLPKTLLELQKAASVPVSTLPEAAIHAADAITLAPPKEDTTLKEWVVRLRFKRFEVPASFVVCLFVGDVPASPSDWIANGGFAGSFEVFDNASPELCPNCQETNQYIEGYVQCNFTIISHLESDHPDLEEESVVSLLRKKLSWAVVNNVLGVIDLKRFPSLEVTFGYSPLELPFGAESPTRGEAKFFDVIPDFKQTY